MQTLQLLQLWLAVTAVVLNTAASDQVVHANARNNDSLECALRNDQDGSCIVYGSSDKQAGATNDDNALNKQKRFMSRKLDMSTCQNEHVQCDEWAAIGECANNPMYMQFHCRQACVKCNQQVGPNLYNNSYGEVQDFTQYTAFTGVDEGEALTQIHQYLMDTEAYMYDEVYVDERYKNVKVECKNRHAHCALWAALGECDSNPGYMTINCAPSCKTCIDLDFSSRCPYDPELMPNIWKAGDLNTFFERVMTDWAEYEPNVLSSPQQYNYTDGDGPWVVTLDNFITTEECERLMILGESRGYNRSEDVGAKNFDGSYSSVRSENRTSTNTWCVEDCYHDPLVQQVLHRIENLTLVPGNNSEYLQLLHYDKKQRYDEHHDYIEHEEDRQEGPRILTVYLYLNDEGLQGGGTRFPGLDITVMPKRGRVLIWPSVLDSDPTMKDYRTNHAALPVEGGVKYGANAWVHLRDFKSPYASGCA